MKTFVKFLALLALVTLAFSSCDVLLQTTSIRSRIKSFESDLNSEDRSTIYLNFSPELTDSYDNIKDSAYWESTPLAYANRGDDGYVITIVDVSDPSNVTATLSNANYDAEPVTFVMVKDGFGYLIKTFSMDADTSTTSDDFVIKRL